MKNHNDFYLVQSITTSKFLNFYSQQAKAKEVQINRLEMKIDENSRMKRIEI